MARIVKLTARGLHLFLFLGISDAQTYTPILLQLTDLFGVTHLLQARFGFGRPLVGFAV